MRTIGTTERRVVGALLVTALLPLVAAIVLANAAIRRASEDAIEPLLRAQVERSIATKRELAGALRRAMHSEASALAADPSIVAALRADRGTLERVLAGRIAEDPSIAEIALLERGEVVTARARRAVPIDPGRELAFPVRRAVASSEQAFALEVVFAADARRLDDSAPDSELQAWRADLARARLGLTGGRTYGATFGALLGLTVLLAVVVGVRVVRPVTKRLEALVAATRPVAEGDLSVRVPEVGDDDLAELSRAFNRMLLELDRSRSRIEFLRRVGQWQTVARRLAHEIKNPLTPIQLAVEECRQRYRGDDESFRSLLETTHDIVTEEVASLRTLVGEFAAFARLPRAHLRPGDLGDALREAWPRLERDRPSEFRRPVRLELDVPDEPMPAALDRTMLHRALANLVANAVQATGERDAPGEGRVRVSATRSGEWCAIAVEDDGPGIPDVLKAAVFDPYVTTRKTGTGLGLSIVQKIVLDHGGTVEVGDAPGGGARFVVRLPASGSPPSEAALSRSHSSAWGSGSGSEPGLA